MFEKSLEFEQALRKKTHYFDFWLPLRALNNAFNILKHVFKEEQNNEKNGGNPLLTGVYKKGDYKVKFLSNLTVYVITICNMEGIIIRLVDEIIKFSKFIKIHIDEKKYSDFKKDRNNEIETYLWYRNKLFAHTSYAYPKEETESIRETLLYYYAGELIAFRPEGFYLGGVSKIADADQAFMQGKEELPMEEYMEYQNSITPPELLMMRDHQNLIEHFKKWEEFICNLFQIIFESI